jgi:hypothetical protein
MQSLFLSMVSQSTCVTLAGISLLPPNWSAGGIFSYFQHRIPIDRRIILCRGGIVRRRNGGEIELLARLGLDLGRIDQSIAAHPDLIFGLRQVGHHVAALVVGDDHLGIAGGQVVRFCDHPDAGFRPLGSGDHTTDVVIVDGNGSLGAEPCRHCSQESGGDRRDARIDDALHANLPIGCGARRSATAPARRKL